MKCNQALPELDAFSTGELDTVGYLKVQAHLIHCPSCARRLDFIRQMHMALMTKPRDTTNYFALREARRRGVVHEVLKRAFDVVMSIGTLLVFSPLLILIGIMIKATSRGPVFVLAPRVGRFGRVFSIIRFRTTVSEPNASQNFWSTVLDNAKTTPLGTALRLTKLHQFPEFINVIRGEMSIVGPKPYEPKLANLLDNEARQIIYTVRPGIFGATQLCARSEYVLLKDRPDKEARYIRNLLEVKRVLDMEYVVSRSIVNDIVLLLMSAYSGFVTIVTNGVALCCLMLRVIGTGMSGVADKAHARLYAGEARWLKEVEVGGGEIDTEKVVRAYQSRIPQQGRHKITGLIFSARNFIGDDDWSARTDQTLHPRSHPKSARERRRKRPQ